MDEKLIKINGRPGDLDAAGRVIGMRTYVTVANPQPDRAPDRQLWRRLAPC
jgi:hypothetical protein